MNDKTDKSKAGYVKIHRSMFDNPLFSRHPEFIGPWVWMIAEARFKANGIGRGQLRLSKRELHKKFTYLSVSKCERFLGHCVSHYMVEIEPQSGTKLSLVTICNYEKYQHLETSSEPLGEPQGAKIEPQSEPSYKNVSKNDKKEENTSVPDDVRAAFAKFIAFADHTGLPKPGKLSAKRKQKIKARLNEHGLENWIVALRRAAKSDFIRSARWFTIDWLAANETNITKVLEGNYDNKQKPQEQTADEKFIERVRRENEGQPLPMPANGGSLLQ